MTDGGSVDDDSVGDGSASNGPVDSGSTDHVVRGERRVPVLYDVDVAVVGAGAAGMAAACAAAEEGAETVLVDAEGYFGGTSTGGGLATFCGFFSCASADREPEKIVAGFADRVLDGLEERNSLEGPIQLRGKTSIYVYDPEALKLVFDDLVVQSGVTPLLDALVTDVLTVSDEDGQDRVEAIVVETPGGPRAIRARQVVDASGDGVLAHAAGAAVNHVPEEAQSSTTIFFAGGVDEDVARAHRMPDVRSAMAEAVERGDYDLPKVDGIFLLLSGKGKAWINFTDVPVDATDPEARTWGEIDGRRQAEAYMEFFRNELPGFEDAYIDSLAPRLGIRETRKVVGEYVLEHEDFLENARFSDAVAHCGWAREVHDPETRASDWEWLPEGGHYDVPFRSLVVRDLENALVAGRCASASHEVQASMRVIGTAFAMGEAAGVAASMATRGDDKALRDVDVGRIQSDLRRRDAFLRDGLPGGSGP